MMIVPLDPRIEAANLVDECKPLAFSGLSIEPDSNIEFDYAKKIALAQIEFAEKFMERGKEIILTEKERGIRLPDGSIMTSQMRYLERLKEEILKLKLKK